MNPDSKRFSVNWKDLTGLVKNAALVGLAASLAYVGANVGDVDLGDKGVLIVPIIAILIDTGVKWLKSNKPKDEPPSE
jgi:hypothetical protein